MVFKSGPSNLAMFFLGAAIVSWLAFLFAGGFPLFAWAYYNVRPSTSKSLSRVLSETARVSKTGVKSDVKTFSLPEKDESLVEGHILRIPAIEVDTGILEGGYDEYERVFRKGVWRVPDFAVPEETNEKTMILAAHRFGYLEWSRMHRRKNSFYNLPKLEENDEISVIWDKREYKYKVTRVVEAEKIDSYESDLILYTCKFLVSPLKIFVYAQKVN